MKTLSSQDLQNRLRLPGLRSISGWLVLCFLMLLVLSGVSVMTYRQGLEELSDESSIRLQLFVTYLRGVLEKYESLPEILAGDEQLVDFLLNPHGSERVESANRYLETINQISKSADTYLMDKEGLTIAASNWQSERPFVGRNFSYRPYFQQAMQGNLGRYFALGTTSIKRGYYFAYPVKANNEILGAVVIKVDIDDVESKWGQRDQVFLVTGPDGVIFITTNPEWKFRSMGAIEPEVLELIDKSRRYPITDISVLNMEVSSSYPFGEVIKLSDRGGGSYSYLKQSYLMEDANWNAQILVDTKPIRNRLIWLNFLMGATILCCYLLFQLFQLRRIRVAEFKRYEDQARLALLEANEMLETRVGDRTRELVTTNEKLLREIQERKTTEEILKRTRSELVHAAKMATLGQMSAGINHELNQPLAAIRSYTDNARQLLAKQRHEEADWNMIQIGELTDRMVQLGIQLKEFSRKSRGTTGKVPLHAVVDGALEILSPAIRKSGVEIVTSIEPEDLEVKGNLVLLQQVMVNLLNNGLQALEGCEERTIKIRATAENGTALINILDTGKGIDPENSMRIFEPFFTTKKPGQGIGLGLTITERILQEMNGSIWVEKSERGGRFVFSLPVETSPHDRNQQDHIH